ncbi:IclR family transcriptional regulator [Cetobacterium sp.]|uniref:IclR family transcriptional regulator n=1 Tax=Cetobacterium sp. TaxID=2071632 RepID=UPI003F386B71
MSVKSAQRVFEIFNVLAESSEGFTCKEIAIKLNYAQSSTFELLQTMKENGYVLMNGSKKYFLGISLIRLGYLVNKRLDLKNIIRPYLLEIMNLLSETTFLGMINKDKITYIDKVQSTQTVATNAGIGSTKPIYCTGLGKAILSFMDENKVKNILKDISMDKFTENTVTDKDEFFKNLKKYKELGYALDDEEIETGLWCLSVPIFNSLGVVELAISVSGPKERMLKKYDLIKEVMIKKGQEISKALGYIGR